MSSKPIFISHATVDKELADKFVTLIESGIGISDSEVFCTSLEGLGIPSGENFIGFIKAQIQSPKAVILLLTSQYYASEFCLCELGASWSMSHRGFPLLLPPLTYDHCKGVLLGTQALLLNDKRKLSQFRDEITDLFKIKGKPVAIWEKRRDEFLEWLESYMSSYQLPAKVDPSEHEKLQKNYNEAANALVELEDQIEQLKGQNEKLAALKDRKQVDIILEEDMEELEEFTLITDEAAKALSALPKQVKFAFYNYFNGEPIEWPSGRDTEDDVRDFKECIRQDFFIDDSFGIKLNTDDPTVEEAIDSVNKVEKFVENASDEFFKYYKREYKKVLNFTSERFWTEHLY